MTREPIARVRSMADVYKRQGEFEACAAAGPVYRLLAKQDMGTTNMPAPDQELISGDLAFREHAGGHTDLPDWPTFLKFADKYFKSP